jgi:hypothetical protein
MTNQDSVSQVLCFKCASIYTPSSVDKYTCPFCHHSVDKAIYTKILNYAKTAVHYGYSYRKAYENQVLTEGSIATKYSLPEPVTVLCFAGVAALSGIIGNAAYDLVKRIISRLIASSTGVADGTGQTKIHISNETDIQVFIQYIKEFHEDKSAATPEIRWEVEKERIIKNLEHTLFPLLSEGTNPGREAIHEAIKAAVEEDHNVRPTPPDFDSFWVDADE